MKELLKHIQRYGEGWTIMFRVGKTNALAIGLEYFDMDANKIYREEALFSTKMVDSMRAADPILLNTLDRMRMNVLKKRK